MSRSDRLEFKTVSSSSSRLTSPSDICQVIRASVKTCRTPADFHRRVEKLGKTFKESIEDCKKTVLLSSYTILKSYSILFDVIALIFSTLNPQPTVDLIIRTRQAIRSICNHVWPDPSYCMITAIPIATIRTDVHFRPLIGLAIEQRRLLTLSRNSSRNDAFRMSLPLLHLFNHIQPNTFPEQTPFSQHRLRKVAIDGTIIPP